MTQRSTPSAHEFTLPVTQVRRHGRIDADGTLVMGDSSPVTENHVAVCDQRGE